MQRCEELYKPNLRQQPGSPKTGWQKYRSVQSPSHSTSPEEFCNLGDISSPTALIAGIDRIFRRHDVHTAGVTAGSGDSSRVIEYCSWF